MTKFSIFVPLFGGFGVSHFFALFVALIVTWYYYMTKDYGKWEKKGLHSIKPTFLLGNLKEVFTLGKHVLDFHIEFYRKMDGYR